MKQTIIISLIVGLLAFLGGYYLNQAKYIFGQKVNNYQSKAVSPQKGDVKINSLSGMVKKINGSSIILVLKTNQADERTVEIDTKTEIYVLEQKDPIQYQKEVDEYLKKTQEQMNRRLKPGEISTAPIVSELSPEIFTKKPGSIANIKNGILLTVVAVQDIKDAKQFKAVRIFIPPAPNAADSSTITPLK